MLYPVVLFDPNDTRQRTFCTSTDFGTLPRRAARAGRELTGAAHGTIQNAGFLLASVSSSRSGLMAESLVPFCTVGVTSRPVTASNTAVSGLKA